MKQFKSYIIILLLVALIAPSTAFAVWWNPLTWFNNWGRGEIKNEQKVLPINNTSGTTTVPENNTSVTTAVPESNTSGTTTVYGVEMQNKCFTKFQDFIKTYGADYSKCLADFDFNEEYCVGFDPATEGLSDINLIVILDSSGSMAEKIGSQAKIDVAKKAVSDLLIKMPKGVNTGLVVYGHKGSNSAADKSLSCKGIEEVVKLGTNNSSNIIAAMDSFNPKGWTPIAGSLDFAKNIFKNSGTSNKNYLILVSDGVESCDGDPLTAAEGLKAEIPGIKLNVIGFTNDSKTQEFLEKIATVGGGSYLTASNSSDIAKAFNDELLAIKEDCLSVTLFQMYSRNNANNMSNLNCWLAAYDKESDDFTANILQNSFDTECNLEMSNALRLRQNEFWYKKEALAEKNSAIYDKIKSDFNNQLKVLESSKN